MLGWGGGRWELGGLVLAAGIAIAGMPPEGVRRPSPREAVLDVLPPDAAVVLLASGWHDQYQRLRNSPWARQWPQTQLGQAILQSEPWRQLDAAVAAIGRELQITPEQLLSDVLGEAVGFAYQPPAERPPQEEYGLLVIVPRQPATLRQLVQRIEQLQLRSGELRGIDRRRHPDLPGQDYSVRTKASGEVDYYAFCGDRFVYSGSEAAVQAALQRAAAGQPSPHRQRLARLVPTDAVVTLLVQPRALDPLWQDGWERADKPVREVGRPLVTLWQGIDDLAAYLRLDTEAELGLVVRYDAARLPAAWRKELARSAPSRPWLPPPQAWIAVQLHGHPRHWLQLPETPQPTDVPRWLAKPLGPIVGQDKLPQLLQSLGPDWAAWLEPPPSPTELPAAAVAIALSGDAPRRRTAAQSLLQTAEFLFHSYRFTYNAAHADQIDWFERRHGPTIIKGLINPHGLPNGFAPAYAVTGDSDYLIVATSPQLIERWLQRPRHGNAADSTVAVVQVAKIRDYLLRHGDDLAAQLARFGTADAPTHRRDLRNLALLAEWIDQLRLEFRRDRDTLRLLLRVKASAPLK